MECVIKYKKKEERKESKSHATVKKEGAKESNQIHMNEIQINIPTESIKLIAMINKYTIQNEKQDKNPNIVYGFKVFFNRNTE